MTTVETELAGTARASAIWVLVTVLVGLCVPFGGFAVALLSRLPRFAAGRPSWVLLTLVAAAVVVVQLVGLQASWVAPVLHSSPAQIATS